MKKTILIFLLIFIFGMFAGCEPQPEKELDPNGYLKQMFGVAYSNADNGPPSQYLQSPSISSRPVEVVLKQEGEPAVFTTASRTFDLTYKSSFIFSLYNLTVHQYAINDTEGGLLYITDDGELYGITGDDDDIAMLNIAPNASSEEIIEALKSSLADLVDFENYPDMKGYYGDDRAPGEDFGLICFASRNLISGYQKDIIDIAVLRPGAVIAVWFRSLNYELTEQDIAAINSITPERENELIELRLRDVCNVREAELRSYEMIVPPIIAMQESSLYIYYTLGITAYENEYDHEYEFQDEVLIPLSLLSDNGTVDTN